MALFNSMSSVLMLGNMTADINVRTLSSGTVVGDFSIALNERIKQGDKWVDDTSFIDVTVWGKTAELVQRFGGKGKLISIQGTLKQDTWKDKDSGQKRSKVKVVASSVTFVQGQGQGQGQGQKSSDPKPEYEPTPEAQGDDSIPF